MGCLGHLHKWGVRPQGRDKQWVVSFLDEATLPRPCSATHRCTVNNSTPPPCLSQNSPVVRWPEIQPAERSQLESACYVVAHQKQQLLGLLGEEPREVGLLVADRPEQLVLVAPVERRLPDQHLVEQDAEGPPVHAVRVLHPLDDLGEGGMCEVSISTSCQKLSALLARLCPEIHF